jgi:hypothetical protein
MLNGTGAISFWLGISVIALSFAGFGGVYYLVKSNSIENEKLDKLVEIAKWCIVSVAITISATIVNDGFREREQEVKEIEMFNKYIDTVMAAKGEEQRKLLSEYFATVSPAGPIRDAWINYEKKVDAQIARTVQKEDEIQKLQKDTLNNVAAQAKIDKLKQEVETAKTGSLAPSKVEPGDVKPRLFVQISSADQKEKLQGILAGLTKTMNITLPGFEIIQGYKGKNELRYFDESERDFVNNLVSNLNSVGLTVSPKYVPGYKVKPFQFELWISEIK